jgi:hypothetical protein
VSLGLAHAFVLLGPCLIALTLLVASGLAPTTSTTLGLVRVAVTWVAVGAGVVMTMVGVGSFIAVI